MLICVKLHTKNVIDHAHLTKTKGWRAKYTETKHSVSLIASEIKYAHKLCVFGHTKCVVLACCERVITSVLEII